MLSFPNAKINLGLNILSKRPDGYHNIESCFYPIFWGDVLEVIASDTFSFTSSGLEIPGESENNLCCKAYNLLLKDFDLAPVHIHLHKVIPMGAGLGGGSADGAFTLKMLNQLFDLKLSPKDLEKYAATLGSDCPFFIRNEPVIVSGTGTELERIKLDLSGFFIALKYPGIHIGTKEAYSKVIPGQPPYELRNILMQPISCWKEKLRNDFEPSVFPNHPEINDIKTTLYNHGALYATMTGSGSTVYGIFTEKPHIAGFKAIQL